MTGSSPEDGDRSAGDDEEIRALRKEILRLVLETVQDNPGKPIPVQLDSQALKALTAELKQSILSLTQRVTDAAAQQARDASDTRERLRAVDDRVEKLGRRLVASSKGKTPGRQTHQYGMDEEEDKRRAPPERRALFDPPYGLDYLWIVIIAIALFGSILILASRTAGSGGAVEPAANPPPDTEIILENEISARPPPQIEPNASEATPPANVLDEEQRPLVSRGKQE